MTEKEKLYPGFTEYKLLDLIQDEISFKRGASKEMLHNFEYEKWQDFFSSKDYSMPCGKNIAFFHPCTWSKPYDFSLIGSNFKDLVSSFPNVHRIIISNSGVIPYEYQLNKTFCSYDWNILFENDKKKRLELFNDFQKTTIDRIERYLTNNHYDAVIHVGLPIKQSISNSFRNICNKLEIPYYRAPGVNTYQNNKKEMLKLKDDGEFFTIPAVKEDIFNLTKKVSEKYCN